MKKIHIYIKASFYNIRQNKIYSLFYILGTALTFVFVILILQYIKLISSDSAPMLNSDRLFTVENFFKDDKFVGFINPQDISLFESYLPGKQLLGIDRNQPNVISSLNGHYKATGVGFVGRDYFDIYQFNFVAGRAFSKEEADAGEKKAVIKQELAEKYLPKGKAIGSKIIVQDIEYEVIGIVEDYSTFSAPNIQSSIWVSYKYNKGIPSSFYWYKISILFSPEMEKTQMKEQLANAVKIYFENKNQEVDFKSDDILTAKENKLKQSSIGSLEIGAIVFLLLLIPALNIVTLNMANSYTRAEEFAIRRAIGASQLSVFFQQMGEIFILVFIGLLIGILMTLPVLYCIQNIVFGSAMEEEVALIPYLDYSVILFQVFPLAILFAFLSGGLPSYIVTIQNISLTLKGGDKQ